MISDVLIMSSWEVKMFLFGIYCFRGTCLPLKHWNPSNHKVSQSKDWNYYLKFQCQSMQVHFSIKTWNSFILGSRLNLNPSITERLTVNRLRYFYSTNGIRLVTPALREMRLWKPIFTCQSNYIYWPLRRFILLLRLTGILNFLSYEIFTSKKT